MQDEKLDEAIDKLVGRMDKKEGEISSGDPYEWQLKRNKIAQMKLELKELKTEMLKEDLLQLELERIKAKGGSIKDLEEKKDPVDLEKFREQIKDEIFTQLEKEDQLRDEGYKEAAAEFEAMQKQAPNQGDVLEDFFINAAMGKMKQNAVVESPPVAPKDTGILTPVPPVDDATGGNTEGQNSRNDEK